MPAIRTWTGKALEPLHRGDGEYGELRIKLPPNTNAPWGQILIETATPGTYTPIAGAPVGGEKFMLLKYDTAVDATGNHWKGTAPGLIEESDISCTAFKQGEFDTRDLKGIGGAAPTQAMIDALGRLIQGTPAAGIVRLI